MSFRTVVISNLSKLNYKNQFLVVKQELDEKYIHLSEIDTVIIDSIAVSISNYLLKELINHKINIIFCDEKHNPYAELASYYSSHNTSKKILIQSKWSNINKNKLWKSIISNKLLNQYLLLKKLGKEKTDLVHSYIGEVLDGDKTNREGHAAKIYFNSLFGNNFIRHNSDKINAALNYGYVIILSTINKEIASNGYCTQIGIHHKNEFNQFNLACDLMEPFRVIVDNFVYHNQDNELDKNTKYNIVNILNNKYKYNKKTYTLKDLLKLYVKNTLDCISDEKEYKEFIYEEE